MPLDPVVSTIEVPCDQRTAFVIFTEEMARWWPLEKRSMSIMDGQTVRELRVQPRLGGRIVEIGSDGREHLWGTYRAFEPPDSLRLDFHMGLPPEQASTVEVTFTPVRAERTRVVLTQSNWEAFGPLAEMMRKGYGSSWALIFEEGYGEACARSSG